MTKGVYFVSDGSVMCFDDLKDWMIYEVSNGIEKCHWNFDDFTGGRDCFSDNESYLKGKKWFDTYKAFVKKNEIKK